MREPIDDAEKGCVQLLGLGRRRLDRLHDLVRDWTQRVITFTQRAVPFSGILSGTTYGRMRTFRRTFALPRVPRLHAAFTIRRCTTSRPQNATIGQNVPFRWSVQVAVCLFPGTYPIGRWTCRLSEPMVYLPRARCVSVTPKRDLNTLSHVSTWGGFSLGN